MKAQSFCKNNVGKKERRKSRQSKQDNAKSLVRMFKEESKKLDEVLSSYDNIFKMSSLPNSPEGGEDRPFNTGKAFDLSKCAFFR